MMKCSTWATYFSKGEGTFKMQDNFVKNFCFIDHFGCLVKISPAKILLREKMSGEEKKYTQNYILCIFLHYWIQLK